VSRRVKVAGHSIGWRLRRGAVSAQVACHSPDGTCRAHCYRSPGECRHADDTCCLSEFLDEINYAGNETSLRDGPIDIEDAYHFDERVLTWKYSDEKGTLT
jgi:hypothetical protein